MSRKTSRHHCKPKSINGTRDISNISHVDAGKHSCWHQLFYNYTAQKICRIINETWLDRDYKFVCVEREKDDE